MTVLSACISHVACIKMAPAVGLQARSTLFFNTFGSTKLLSLTQLPNLEALKKSHTSESRPPRKYRLRTRALIVLESDGPERIGD